MTVPLQIPQTIHCEWLIFCGATWPPLSCNRRKFALWLKLLYVYLFLWKQAGKRLGPIQQVETEMSQSPNLDSQLNWSPCPSTHSIWHKDWFLLAHLMRIFMLHVAKSCHVNPLTASILCCALWCKIDLHYPLMCDEEWAFSNLTTSEPLPCHSQLPRDIFWNISSLMYSLWWRTRFS